MKTFLIGVVHASGGLGMNDLVVCARDKCVEHELRCGTFWKERQKWIWIGDGDTDAERHFASSHRYGCAIHNHTSTLVLSTAFTGATSQLRDGMFRARLDQCSILAAATSMTNAPFDTYFLDDDWPLVSIREADSP